MVALPAALPSTTNARLPVSYERAKAELANCASIDECRDWANRAEALASYAKQADDDSLRQLADRIQARAVRRCGELLKTFDGRGGDRSKTNGTVISAPSQKQAATEAGMSERQRVTAVRVANVPANDFESAVESEAPPTVTRLAEMGTKKREAPPNMARATHAWGVLREFAEWCQKNQPEDIAQGIYPHEVSDMRSAVSTIDGWLDRFVVNLKE